MDPDPGGPKTCESGGSGSATLGETIHIGQWQTERVCVVGALLPPPPPLPTVLGMKDLPLLSRDFFVLVGKPACVWLRPAARVADPDSHGYALCVKAGSGSALE